MKGKNNKIRKKREVKTPIPQSLVKRVEKATLGYGKLRDFADRAGLDYNTVHNLKKSALATPTVREKVETALKAA